MPEAAGRHRGSEASVLVIGDVMVDIIVRPEGAVTVGADRRATIRALPGGSGANQAAWLAAHGLHVRFAGRVAARDRALQADLLEKAGVEAVLACDELLPTGTIVALISPDGERSFLTDRGANDRLCRADLPVSLLDGIGLVHVSGYALVSPGPRGAVLDLLEAARRRDIPVSIDPGSHSFLEEVGPANFLAWTEGARFCFPNASEAAMLSGEEELEAQLRSLTRHYDLVVIKLGQRGAVAAASGSGECWSGSAPGIAPVDTTGAGDAFLGGFLSSYLAGREIETCLQQGVSSGSWAVASVGGRPPADQNRAVLAINLDPAVRAPRKC